MIQIRKSLLCFALMAFLSCLCGCGASKMTREEKAMQRQMTAQKIKDSLDNRTFKIDLNYVIPQRMRAHSLEYGYSIEVKGDSVDAFIPFFGEAYLVGIGTQDEGLKFKGLMSGYEVLPVKKNLYRVNILAKKPLDEILYQIEVYENGVSSLFVRSQNRENIRFNGEMVIND